MEQDSSTQPRRGVLSKLHNTLPYTTLMERVLLFIFATILLVATIVMLWRINENFLVRVPAEGGTLTEGIIGTPRFINPILALTEADKDLSSLIYTGLMRPSKNGLALDIADSYEVSSDGLSYTFHIRDDAKFHNGDPVTSADVAYTVSMAQDPVVKSPQRSNWDGIETQIVNAKTITFVLKQPYYSFIENATLGILPKSIWENLSPEEFSLSGNNTNPVGNGPYKIDSIKKDKDGFPREYTLKPFSSYTQGKAHISEIVVKLFTNQSELLSALTSGDVDSASGIAPTQVKELTAKNIHFETVTLPRVFAVFFNQNKQTIFSDIVVREALSAAIDRNVLIEVVLNSFGKPLDGPTPDDVQITPTEEDLVLKAQTLLEEDGWKKNEEDVYSKTSNTLTFTITTADVPELKAAAEFVQNIWRLVGADVDVEVFDTTALNQNIIRPREFDALLFGEVVGRDRDLYPFWHSSGRNDPGLNVALYTNGAVDKLLDTMRKTTDPVSWETDYEAVREEIKSDYPATFLYSPELIYVVPTFVNNFSFADTSTASERFGTIHEWYIDTQRVWKIFANNY